MKTGMILLILLIAICGPAFAADRGTPLEAKSMLAEAVAHYQAVGRSRALADFTAKIPPFGDRDLYVVCIDTDRKITASGGFPEYVGLSAEVFFKNTDGKSIPQEAWDLAINKGQGEIHYDWFNPASLFIERKVTFFARTGDDVCGVGAYEAQ